MQVTAGTSENEHLFALPAPEPSANDLPQTKYDEKQVAYPWRQGELPFMQCQSVHHRYRPEQFADHIPELYEAVLTTEQLDQQVFSGTFSPGS